MGLEKQPSGRFDAHCDECDKVIELNAYGPAVAGYKLRLFGWKRVDHTRIVGAHGSRLQHFLWHCTTCCEKELAL